MSELELLKEPWNLGRTEKERFPDQRKPKPGRTEQALFRQPGNIGRREESTEFLPFDEVDNIEQNFISGPGGLAAGNDKLR